MDWEMIMIYLHRLNKGFNIPRKLPTITNSNNNQDKDNSVSTAEFNNYNSSFPKSFLFDE